MIMNNLQKEVQSCFLQKLSPEELNIKLSEAWLGVLINENTIFNPLEKIPVLAHDRFSEYLIWLMGQPDYFYFIIKIILQMDSYPMQCLILKELYNHKFPILLGSRGLSKSYSLAMFLIIKMITIPGCKCVITGAGFRQAKVVFDYMEQMWIKSPMLRNCFKGGKNGPVHGTDVWTFRLGDSITYALPVGPDGSKIRGYRANCLIAEEFASVQRTVFEEVMSGFLAVSASPVEQVKHQATLIAKRKLLLPISTEEEDSGIMQNQLILSGTAYYKFNHFYQYFDKWRKIIYSGGDKAKLAEIFGLEDGQKLENVNWKNYSIIRIPVELAPVGFMDMDQINRTKASSSKDVYLREFACTFSDDSDGFFKRSLINFCTVSNDNKIEKGGQEIKFGPILYGDQNKKYIYGIDPAYQGDNFAIVILEVNDDHRRVVHVWTTQASDHKQRLKDGLITENDYYHYCVRKIRTLMKRFPCAYIALDALGGGRAIIEAFTDVSKLEEGEVAILPIIDREDKPKDTDFMEGDHIIQIINFTSDWISQANHALKKDMEARDIIFPYHDSVSYTLAEFYDQSLGEVGQLYDTLEDCVFEIEELKKELSIITITETSTGRERFDTPELKTGIAKKGRLRKDRYSALLMANWIARTADIFSIRPLGPDIMTMSGFVDKKNPHAMFHNTSPLAKSLNDLYM